MLTFYILNLSAKIFLNYRHFSVVFLPITCYNIRVKNREKGEGTGYGVSKY